MKKNLLTISLRALIVLLFAVSNGITGTVSPDWVVFSSPTEHIKFEMPKGSGLSANWDKTVFRSYSGSIAGANLRLQAFSKVHEKSQIGLFPDWATRYKQLCNLKQEATFTSLTCEFSDDYYDYIYRVIAFQSRFYIGIGYLKVGNDKSHVRRFVNSIQPNGNTPDSKTKIAVDMNGLIRKAFEDSKQAVPERDFSREKLKTLIVQPKTNSLFSSENETGLIKILSRPKPQYTTAAQSFATTGPVKLKLVFAADRSIQGIEVLEVLPFGLTEEAIRAVASIEFLPATRNGRKVSIRKVLVFNFLIM